MRTLTTFALALLLFLFSSCREDEYVTLVEDEDTGRPAMKSAIVGLYVLNEGNMGSNKCTLDFLDLSGNAPTAHYFRNIYGDRNPQTVMELGDVGNDIGIYGTKLWMAINCSNKVEVCDALTARRLGQVEIANCRYLTFDGGFAYISSYAGPVKIGDNCPLGRVYKVDTLTLQKVDSVTVGYQPEEMAWCKGKLYVANSGGYRVPNYDNRISVIDASSMTVTSKIEVGINLHRLQSDRYGQLWVSSRGDYFSTQPNLYCLSEEHVVAQWPLTVTAMTVVGDTLWYIGAGFSYLTGSVTKEFGLIDVKQRKPIATTLFDAPEIADMEMPYGLMVNPHHHDFYLMDAKNYVSSGELLHFLSDGTFDWRVWTGDIPSRGAFLEMKKDE